MKAFYILAAVSVLVFSGCASTSLKEKPAKVITITDSMMAPVTEEVFPVMVSRINKNWTNKKKKPSVIIYFGYDHRTGNEQGVTKSSMWLQNDLEIKFVNSEKFRIIDKANLDRLLKEKRFQQSGYVSDEEINGIGRDLGGNYMVFPVNNRYNQMQLKITNVETSELVYSYTYSFGK